MSRRKIARIPALALLGAILVTSLVSIRAEAFDSIWEASSGALPDSACPPWIAAISDSAPMLSPGSLRIRTTACSRSISYRQADADIQIPATLVVEARLRLESRGECVGPCGHYRDAASINITTAPHVGTVFFVGNDEIFVPNGECSGITSVSLDTHLSAHTYRIVVSGGGAAAAASGAAGLVAWPNPFSAETTLRYSIPSPTRVRIDLYDVSGRCVRSLVDEDADTGEHLVTWDGLDAGGRAVSPGPYVYRITTSEGEHTGKILRLP